MRCGRLHRNAKGRTQLDSSLPCLQVSFLETTGINFLWVFNRVVDCFFVVDILMNFYVKVKVVDKSGASRVLPAPGTSQRKPDSKAAETSGESEEWTLLL